MYTAALASRFWQKVNKTEGCWLWTASLRSTGYGQIHVKSYCNPEGAHRVSYELHYGPIPKGMDVCHHCDVRHCVRPSHLFLGTRKQNMQDASAKGRLPNGASKPAAKLSEQDVIEIRQLVGYITQNTIAARYGVSIALVSFIINRKQWTHI